MGYITTRQTARAAAQLTESRLKLARRLTPKKTLFLSHSRLDDATVVRGAIAILEEHGAKVYIDDRDRSIGRMPMDERCEHLRDVIRQCEHLVVLFSENTHNSRWIPWELGLSDGLHSTAHVATLPIAALPAERPWGKQEYFALYPQVRYVRLSRKRSPEFAVHIPETGLFRPLSKWLAQ